jgi:hypothetical protein
MLLTATGFMTPRSYDALMLGALKRIPGRAIEGESVRVARLLSRYVALETELGLIMLDKLVKTVD